MIRKKKNKCKQYNYIRLFKSKQFFFMLVIVTSLLLISAGLATTYALLKEEDKKINDFSIGDFKMKLVEDFTTPEMTEVDKPYTKQVSVNNTGETLGFVRVLVLPQILGKKDEQGNQLLLPATIGKEVQLDLDTTKWKDGEDGYYYYLGVLEPGQATPSLFTTVTLNGSEVDDLYNAASFTIDIKVEGINATKWAYQDAWWNGIASKWSDEPLKGINDTLKNKVIN